MTMIICCFDEAPTVDPQLVEKEEKWKVTVRQAVNGQFNSINLLECVKTTVVLQLLFKLIGSIHKFF